MLVLSYYTEGNGYKEESERLEASCVKHAVPFEIKSVKDLGSWDKNTHYKALFLARARVFYRGPLVWLDADAEIKQYPVAFDVLQGSADVAVHYRDGRELLSGTIWVEDNLIVRDLLSAWVRLNNQHPKRFDQKNLAEAISMLPNLRVHRLPPSYCLIFDLMRHQGPAHIEHHQASRRLKT
jgi:hypothetical protein